MQGDDTAGEELEPHGLEAAGGEQVGELLRPWEAAHASRQVRVRVATGQDAAEQGDDAVEPEAVERREPAARGRDLENPEPAAGAEHPAQLLDRRLEVLDVADTEADDRRLEGRVLEREREHVALHEFEPGRLAPSTLEHPLGEVEADDSPRAGLGRGHSEVAGAAARVEHVVAAPHCLANRRPAPALVEPDGHHAVHRVVDRRDPVEHPLHSLGRQAAGLDRHVV